MTKKPKTYWAAFDKEGEIKTHHSIGWSVAAVYVRKRDAEWHGDTKDVRKVKIVEVTP